ncbi:Crp/Fnr family transcriptional regulator [Thermochromatium tepidum]|uniref:Cyclic nucleotide-binding domain-containing protein n=1 Tax=Thermochromatium tepidum ATCC 43061 TaxID=316276 RepID=A0A6I6EFL3_THETI|nr:Crp/Fnr family transcriptional regulator [Thermochromatium tepidum]QGU32990.1 cyclic nucleotide-binding domain-containing protein [Thermochromatium tepidum ATCC 43061]
MIDELRRAPLFSRLEPNQLERVVRHASRFRLSAEQLLFSQGDPATRFYLLLSGQMRLFRLSPEGAEKVIEIVNPGQTFAEALMFLNAPRYPVGAAALADSELIAIDSSDFAAMLRESVATCFVLLGALSQRLRALIGEIDDLTLHTATSRVARYLASHLPPGARSLELDVRKAVLASRLSVQPETFSRVIKSLTEQGVIRMEGALVRVLDPHALLEIAELTDLLDADDAGSLGTRGQRP